MCVESVNCAKYEVVKSKRPFSFFIVFVVFGGRLGSVSLTTRKERLNAIGKTVWWPTKSTKLRCPYQIAIT